MEITTLEDHEAGWRRDWKSFGSPQFAAFGLLAVAVLILGFWFMRWSTAPTWSMVGERSDGHRGHRRTRRARRRRHREPARQRRLRYRGPVLGDGHEATVVLGDAGVIGGTARATRYSTVRASPPRRSSNASTSSAPVEGELAQTITEMDAVSIGDRASGDPRVERVLRQRRHDPCVGRRQRCTRPGHGRIDRQHRRISVPDLDPGNVTVADTSGRILSSLDGSGMVSDQQLGMQQLLRVAAGDGRPDHARPDPRFGRCGRPGVGGHELRRDRVRDRHLHHRGAGAAAPAVVERGLHRRRRHTRRATRRDRRLPGRRPGDRG